MYTVYKLSPPPKLDQSEIAVFDNYLVTTTNGVQSSFLGDRLSRRSVGTSISSQAFWAFLHLPLVNWSHSMQSVRKVFVLTSHFAEMQKPLILY